MWRLVVRQVATLSEIDTSWSYDDLARANAVLDMQDAMEEAASKEARTKSGKK